MVVEPSGALSVMVLGTPVSMLTPPMATMLPAGALAGSTKLPLTSVVPTK